MKCFKCGQVLPEDSEFCQYCGNKIEVVTETILHKEVDTINIVETSSKEKLPKNKLVIGVVATIIVVLIGLIIYQYTSATALKDEINTLNKKVESLNKQVDEKQEKIDYYYDKYVENRIKSTDYDEIIDFLSSSNAGYSSNNYYASDSIIVLKKNGSSKSINVTCKYYNTTVYAEWDSTKVNAEWSMAWNNNTTSIRIYPVSTGISTIEFTNNANNESFEVMVVVI